VGTVLDEGAGALVDVDAGAELEAGVVAAALPTAAVVPPPPEHAASASVATNVDIPTKIFCTAAYPCPSTVTSALLTA
jgi:hypothetical protein